MKRTRNRIQSLSSRRAGARRKGAAIILAVCLLGVLVSMLAMAIDIGYIAASKAEARRTTDAAALAGCWQIFESSVNNADDTLSAEQAIEAANNIAALNYVCNGSPTMTSLGQDADIS